MGVPQCVLSFRLLKLLDNIKFRSDFDLINETKQLKSSKILYVIYLDSFTCKISWTNECCNYFKDERFVLKTKIIIIKKHHSSKSVFSANVYHFTLQWANFAKKIKLQNFKCFKKIINKSMYIHSNEKIKNETNFNNLLS